MVHKPNNKFALLAAAVAIASCSPNSERLEETMSSETPMKTYEIIVTNEAGDKLALKENVEFAKGSATGTSINVDPSKLKQSITGIGSSFTESSAFVLAHLPPEKRAEVMANVYGEQGANMTLTRTVIGATDFAVNGNYTYADVPNDAKLEHFTIAEDKNGFSRSQYPKIQDESFDLLPMIKEAQAIKANQEEKDLRIVASAWTAPIWMKDIETWYINPSPENDWQGTGGELKPQYEATYADYLVRYLDEYKKEGIDIWGLTPVNEPNGNSGQWESMHFTPKTQSEFVKKYLGPKLKSSDHKDVALLVYDQNRDHLQEWADEILADEETAPYVYGVAVHWYESTYQVNEEALEYVHKNYPGFPVIHTEGTIDDLGKPAPNGVLDPERFQEKNWFANDDFWWNENATDWAYTATWAPKPEDHPIYTPVHRYARNIIVSLNHWMEGWIDWNIVLDHKGGPNHVGNFCGAPIMIDTNTNEIYYTPIYHVLAQFSRTIRPGDVAVQTDKHLVDLKNDDLHASATINKDGLLSVQVLNTTKKPITYQLQVGEQVAEVIIDANALQTVRVKI